MRPQSILFAIIAILGSVACGSDGEPDGDSTDAGADGVGDTSASDTGADLAGGDTDGGATGAALIGEWEFPCNAAGGGYFEQTLMTITATTITQTYTQHKGDSTCSDDSKLALEMHIDDSAWWIGAAFGQGFALDRVLAKASIKILDQGVKSYWDANAGCGPFNLGETKDVSAMRCFGFWYPAVGGTYYTIISVQNDMLQFGREGGGESEATRPQNLDLVRVFRRVGATSPDGFITGEIRGGEYRAEFNAKGRLVQNGHIQIGASTRAVTPWETWVINMPNAVGRYDCDDDGINAYINFGFTEENLPVLWDTEQSGGAGCTIVVTKAAPAVGDTIEGTFEGTLGDGQGNGNRAGNGSFQIVRVE